MLLAYSACLTTSPPEGGQKARCRGPTPAIVGQHYGLVLAPLLPSRLLGRGFRFSPPCLHYISDISLLSFLCLPTAVVARCFPSLGGAAIFARQTAGNTVLGDPDGPAGTLASALNCTKWYTRDRQARVVLHSLSMGALPRDAFARMA